MTTAKQLVALTGDQKRNKKAVNKITSPSKSRAV